MTNAKIIDKKGMNSIVVIDYDQTALDLIERGLESDFKVHCCNSALEALELIEALFPDLILLEVKMPDMDGYELCSKLKTNDATRDIPIIFMSAKMTNASRSLAYRLGAIHYLQKSFDLQELKLLSAAIIRQIKGNTRGNILEFADIFLDIKNHYCEDNHSEYKLTRSECLLLEALMQAQSETVSREILATKLSAHNDRISFRTVDSHICSIRKKIKNSELTIASVYNVGYRLQKRHSREITRRPAAEIAQGMALKRD